jgi:hypothetical protein
MWVVSIENPFFLLILVWYIIRIEKSIALYDVLKIISPYACGEEGGKGMVQKKKEAAPKMKEVHVSFVRRFPLVEKVCPVCGEKFLGTKRAKYDRLACRQKANYARHAEKYSQYNLEKYHRQKEEAAHSAPPGRQKRPKSSG